MNLYGMVGNNAVNRTDKLGLCWGNARAIAHYENPFSGDVDSDETGCTKTIYDNFSTQREEWEEQMKKAAKAKLDSLPAGGFALITDSDSVGAASGVFWIGGWSVGRKYGCTVTKRRGLCLYSCAVSYKMNDKFEDPFDFDNSKTGADPDFWDDWETGRKFSVKHTWTDNIKGK